MPTYDDVLLEMMTSLKQLAILREKEVEDVEKKSDLSYLSYIEWNENEVTTVTRAGPDPGHPPTTTSEAETQTAPPTPPPVTTHKETQTSHPIIMHIDLARSQSSSARLRQGAALLEGEGITAPLFQFDRQAPARISTSPTLRRMRSTRRPLTLASTREESVNSSGDDLSPAFSPLSRLRSPLAAEDPPNPEETSSTPPPTDHPRSHRSKTFDSSISGRTTSLTRRGGLKDFDYSDMKEQEMDAHRLQGRRRSSVVVSLTGFDVSPGDLFVSNGAADILNHSKFSEKKSKWPFSRRSTTKGKTQTHSASEVEKILSTEQVQDWGDSAFHKYKECSVGEFLRDLSFQPHPDTSPNDSPPQDYNNTNHQDYNSQDYNSQPFKKQEAIWEVFTSECVYFLDQLMVLKEVFLSTLTRLQERDCLSDVDPWRLFANLNELCLVSYDFLSSLLRTIRDCWEERESKSTALLDLFTKAFQESICHCLQKYCMNYSTSLQYLDSLKNRPDFCCYIQWCERNPLCRRLRLQDLLVVPLQRLTRYPLLLRNVRKRSSAEEEENVLQRVVEQVETSICDLEGKVKWLENYQKVKQLRDALVWLPVWERDKRAVIPESLKHLLKAVTLENLISHRSLLYEGRLQLTENTKLHDVYLFLFDEFLLITKIKRNKKRSAASSQEQSPLVAAQGQELDQLLKEGCTFTVLDQPVSLDRLQLRNVDQLNASASGLPHSFIIMHQNRYQQVIAAFILQAPGEAVKRVWMTKLESAVTALLKLDSQQPRLKSAALWLESSQI